MSTKETHSIRNGVIATVIGGILLSFWEPFRGLLKTLVLWFWWLLNSAWSWLSSDHQIAGWLLALFVVLSVPSLVKVVSALIRSREPTAENLYKSDRLFGADWEWSYFNGSISNLWCLCPNCKGELIYSEVMPDRYNIHHAGLEPKTDFICEKCGAVMCSLRGDKDYALGTVKREIRRKIRNEEWQKGQSS